MRKFFLIFFVLTSTCLSSEVAKFFNPRTIVVDEVSDYYSNRIIETNRIIYKSKVEYIFKDGKKFSFKQKFKLNSEDYIKIKIYKFSVKGAEFFSDGKTAKLERLFKKDKVRSEENLNLRIFTKRLNLPIKTRELVYILNGNIFTDFDSAKISQATDSNLLFIEDKISFTINSEMQINKITINDGRKVIIEYSDYRSVKNLDYKIPFKISLISSDFRMNINHQSAIIFN